MKPFLCATGLTFSSIVLFAYPATAEPSDPFEVLTALPGDPQTGQQLEAALVYRDMRLYQRAIEKNRATLSETPVGAAFYAKGAQQTAFGFDPLAELVRVLDIAAPRGKPVPAGVVVFTGSQGPGVQLLMKPEPGFLERLATAFASEQPPVWPGQIADGVLTIEVEGQNAVGRIGEDGWFRMAPVETMLMGGTGRNPFAPAMREWTDDLDGLLFLQGGGMAASLLAGELEGIPGQLASSMRTAAVGWSFDGKKTWTTRLLLDVPQFEDLQQVARHPEIKNSLAQLWTDDVSAFLSLSVPPAVTMALLPLLDRELQGGDVQLPDAVKHGLTKLSGRLGVVGFGAGDWAMGVGLQDAVSTRNLVPALQKWWLQVARKLDTDFSKNYQLEPFRGAGEVIHMRPDMGLEGSRMAAIDSTLVIAADKMRLRSLVDRTIARAAKDEEKDAAVVGPVTPPIRAALEKPAMLLGYTILTSEGGVFDYLAWSTASLSQFWKKFAGELPQLQVFGRLLDRLPTYMALEGITWSMMYDMALWADLQGSVLVVQLFNSEI